MGSGGYPSLATDNFCFDDATAVHVEGAKPQFPILIHGSAGMK